ncbi:MAG: succinate dehydrogenase/fumarate reductase flavoprotein subunit [Thaumarchaeota archaeon]|nr:succinate dehydrogenase/fumarate reductase flavoprotein subunit [Nitrososphaerota archaeon]
MLPEGGLALDRSGHDVVIIGSGIAGLRAAIEAARVGEGKADVAVVTKLQAMRSHSVSAEGGTAAVLYPELGDSLESHVFDTVKGSDYLGDQDAIQRLVEMMPAEIYQLEHWGMPWSRREDGRIAQRWFGGYSYPRATFAEDKVGFHEMQTLYDTCTKYSNITFYQEWFATSLVVEQGEFRGLTALEMKTGELLSISAKAGIIATGGAGRLYSFATYGHSSTPDGIAMGYRAGVPLKDMEFVQFHPSGLIPSGILITEGARADGGVLLDKDGARFMGKYAPEKLELASRDVVSRAIITEIEAGRGLKDEKSGYDYVQLDLTGIGAEKVKERLAGIREIAMKFSGIDPVKVPLPVRPVCHYMMGGLDVDIDGATNVKGLWAAGEAACVSINGANRLGANSTAECLVWGRITGAEAARYAARRGVSPVPAEAARAEEKRVFDGIFHGRGGTNPYDVRDSVQRAMDKGAFVYRTEDGIAEALRTVRALRKTDFLHCDDRSRRYNTNLTNVLEVEAMLMAAEAILASALARRESRGAHARRDYPRRDDVGWLRHSLAVFSAEETEGGHVNLAYSPVKITKYQPAERHY